MSRVCLRIQVFGRVQGVGFRYRCAEQAHRLRVSGWVRNRRDGSVEVLAEGRRPEVDAFAAWCQTGPTHARVDKVVVTDEATSGSTTFRIRDTH